MGRWTRALGLAVGLLLTGSRPGAADVEVVRMIEGFEAGDTAQWTRVPHAVEGKSAGATPRVFTAWGGLALTVDGVPEDADGLSFWVRTDDGRTAALTVGLFESEGRKETEAFGARLWATPSWQRYTFPLAGLERVWARAGNKRLDGSAVHAVRFQRLVWSGKGLSSSRVVFDHVAFVKGATRRAVETAGRRRAVIVDAGKPGFRLERFWRALSAADTVEQNTDFAGPEGEAMRIIGKDGTFDIARLAWHVSPHGSSWVKFRYGEPIYSETADGTPRYNFHDQDTLVEHVRSCHLRPLWLLHALPRELAAEAPREGKPACGPPADYGEWRRLVQAFVEHYVDKYGAQEVARWEWEIWNEPDLWWHNWKRQGKHAGYHAYFTLYDHAAAAIRAVVPQARIGGPAVAGYPRDYPRRLLRHAVEGTNAVTGEKGSPLAFLSYHCYAGAFGQMLKLCEADHILKQHAQGRPVGVQVTEYGNAIWGTERAGRVQAAALCQAIDACVHAARQDRARVERVFWFGILRSFATRGDAYFAPANPKARYQITTLFLHVKGALLAKPVYNVYRALNYLDTNWLEISGAHFGEPVHAVATLSEDRGRLSVLLYRHDWDDPRTTGPPQPVTLEVRDLPFGGETRVAQFRIDSHHSDVYAAWQAEGSPAYEAITQEQIARIQAHGHLELAEVRSVTLERGGSWRTEVALEPHAVALVVLTCAP